ncbi:MAG: hypothetical protein WBQ94_05770 [Terracidiphilus sp.]
MPACPAQTFSNITPERFASLEKQAQASGVPIQGNNGTGSKFGGQFAWNYDPATLELTITVTQTPFLMGCESVNARIAALVLTPAE